MATLVSGWQVRGLPTKKMVTLLLDYFRSFGWAVEHLLEY